MHIFRQHYSKIVKEDLPPLYSRICFRCQYAAKSPYVFAQIPWNFHDIVLLVYILKRDAKITTLLANRIHTTELSATGREISECCQKVTCDFTEIVNNHWVEPRSSMSKCEIYFQLFSEITHTILKIDTIVLHSVGRNYCKRYDAN